LSSSKFLVTWPWSGDILNRHDGTVSPQGLTVWVRGIAPVDATVTATCISGEKQGEPAQAKRDGIHFEAPVLLLGQRNVIRVNSNDQTIDIPVLWDMNSQPRYRFSVDDNILFLKDLAESNYDSIFEHWFLGFWHGIHEKYGTKVHFNIFYQTDASVYSGPVFQLPQMPDRFKNEFRANSDWLHLTFHAWQNKPDRPYKDAGYEKMAHDYEAVTEQIKRFAGEEVLSTFTTVHWAEATKEGVRALRDRGVKGLIGLFDQRHNSTPNTRYYLDESLSDHVAKRDYWWDPDMDMIFVSCDSVVNTYSLDDVVPRLETMGSNAHTGELMELLIHEQYFRPELSIYQPDVQEKVIRAVEWVTKRGYKPVFWGDGFVGT